MENIKEMLKNIQENITPRKLLIGSLIFCLFISVVGVTWAWFSPMLEETELVDTTVETGTLSITYNGGNEFSVENILPGWTGTKTFTVTNTGDVPSNYVINWANITNTFSAKGDFVMSVTSTNGGGTLEETQVSSTGTHMNIMNGLVIGAGLTQTYTITFKYINRNSKQNDEGSKISGKIEVLNDKEAETVGIASANPTLASKLISISPTSTGTINSEGLMKVEQAATGQTPAQTEYRYTGTAVNNYITFNDETWRIIGVFSTDDGNGNYSNRVRIIKDTQLTDNQAWNTDCTYTNNYSWTTWSITSGTCNDWTQASLKTYLNEDYYNSLSSTAKTQIDNAKWYINPVPLSKTVGTAQEMYTNERGTSGITQINSSGDTTTRPTSWAGIIGLMYPSDYGYASSGCYTGTKTLNTYNDTTCYSSDWMYKKRDTSYWLLSPRSDNGTYILILNSYGYVYGRDVKYVFAVRPVSNLKSNVTVTGGSGTSSDPYTIE